MLKGEAKTKYMRDYMRRRRAGVKTDPEPKPRQRVHVEPQVDAAAVSMSAQQKLEAAIRQEKRRLASEFEQRVRSEIKKRIVFKLAEFKTIISSLHPDSRKSISNEKLEQAFKLMNGKRLKLVSEEEDPTPKIDPFAKTYAEWEALKRKVSEERKAKRAAARGAGKSSVVRR